MFNGRLDLRAILKKRKLTKRTKPDSLTAEKYWSGLTIRRILWTKGTKQIQHKGHEGLERAVGFLPQRALMENSTKDTMSLCSL